MAAKFGLLIDAKTKGENNIKRLGNSMQGVEGKAKNLGMAVRGAGLAFKALFATAAVGSIIAIGKSAIDTADAFGKLSTRTGIAADKLLAYVNAGKLADVSQSDLETGLRTLARTQVEASEGVKTYADAYAKLGVTVKNQDGTLKDSDQLLSDIADRFQDLPNGPEKAAVAMDIFGRSGQKMITLLNGGSEALDEFGFELSENFARNSETFNDNLTKIGFELNQLKMQILDDLLPGLVELSEGFIKLTGTIRGAAGAFAKFFGIGDDAMIRKNTLLIQGTNKALAQYRRNLKELKAETGPDILGQRAAVIRNIEATVAELERKREVLRDEINRATRVSLEPAAVVPEVRERFRQITKPVKDEKEQPEEKQQKVTKAVKETKAATVELDKATDKYKITLDQVKDTLANQMTSAIEGLIDGTKTLGESLSGLLRTFASMFLRSGIGSLVGSIFPSAKGNVFAQNGIVPYANGGIINRPTRALMGEAGPEAVLPLQRGADGQLGVQVTGEAGMRAAMGRYSRRGGTTGAAVAAEESGSGFGGVGGSGAIDVRYTVERINRVDYVTADQFQRGMQQAAAQGATQGEQRALTTLRQNTSQRKRIGL